MGPVHTRMDEGAGFDRNRMGLWGPHRWSSMGRETGRHGRTWCLPLRLGSSRTIGHDVHLGGFCVNRASCVLMKL
jgi:hypothetical protein